MRLANNCIIVKGAFNSSFVDLLRQKLITIKTEEISHYYDDKNQFDLELLKENNSKFYEFLEDQECLVPNSVEQIEFPTDWDFPGEISNAIVHIGDSFEFDLDLILQLEALGTESIVMMLFKEIDIKKTMSLFKGTNISSVSIYGPSKFLDPESTIKKIQDHRLKSMYVFESEVDKIESTDSRQFIIYSSQDFNPLKGCGFISPDYFSLDLMTYTESIHHNSCLNRKISIDVNGDIKNCPSLTDTFGNIKEVRLKDAIQNSDFKKYWNINKDKIHVCKDCEFRYICTDCRAYVEDPDDILSKPLKCGYNPYTGKWRDWSTNPLKQKDINYY